MSYVIAAFYKFAALSDAQGLRQRLFRVCQDAGVEGTVIVAAEGINGTLAGCAQGIATVCDFLRTQEGLEDLETKQSSAPQRPFHRLKVKLKQEIVTFGSPHADPAARVGTYVEPEDWNALIQRDDVTLIDTRNDFEVRVGQFRDATDPKTRSFSEFPTFVENNLEDRRTQPIAMYCTGGIRCEKATSYLLSQGFTEVYHLKGGILRYLERVPAEESLWQGECFVFDQRVSVVEGLQPGSFELCYGCQSPLSPQERQSPMYERGVACDYCAAQITPERRLALRQRMLQTELAAAQGDVHIGQRSADMQARKQAKRQRKEQERRGAG